MAVLKLKARPPTGKPRTGQRLTGRQLALILQKLDAAGTPEERRRLRREFMRGFYGDDRAQSHA
jgi:hypothetical protein